MKRGVWVVLMLGICSGAWASEAAPAGPDAGAGEVVSREDVYFFLNEARRAMQAVASGTSYVPEPEVASRARAIAERLRAQGVGLIERLIEDAERELMKARPPHPDAPSPPVEAPPERTRT
jgi:hypothetical protein